MALTKSTGSTVGADVGYDTFGGMPSASETVANPFRFTGREWDSETNLYYYRARYYDSLFGRFLSEDPLRSPDEDMYVYVYNNPARYFDPFGLVKWGYPTTVTQVPNLGGQGLTQPGRVTLTHRCSCIGNGHYKLELEIVVPLTVTYSTSDALKHEMNHVSLVKTSLEKHNSEFEHYEQPFPSREDCERAWRSRSRQIFQMLKSDWEQMDREQNASEDTLERVWNWISGLLGAH